MNMQPTFRIIAPEFICPKDEKSSLNQLDDVIITVESEGNATFKLDWTVRWFLVPAPSQRFTLMLWNTVRAVEAKLNRMQLGTQLYLIPNKELLNGVKYIFNVTAIEINEDVEIQEAFYIETLKNDRLNAEQSNTFSLELLGSGITYTDLQYFVEAQVTTCMRSQDYYFVWSIESNDTCSEVNVTNILGPRLEIEAYSLKPGLSYNVTCLLINSNDGELIRAVSLLVEVLYRGLEVYLSTDVITIPIDTTFQLDSIVINHDYIQENLHYDWQCLHEGGQCEFFDSFVNGTIVFPFGISKIGTFEVTIIATVRDQIAISKCTINVVSYVPAIFEIKPIPRRLNEKSVVYITATVYNVSSSSTLTWYFASTEDLAISALNTSSGEYLYGTVISDSLIVNITEDNFLIEQDSNGTDSWEVTAKFTAEAGSAKFVVNHYCSAPIQCSQDIIYCDINFVLNESPRISDVMVMPDNGIAMETIFHISARAMDTNKPLRYTFYCKVGDETLTLGSYMQHSYVNTYLPYLSSDVLVWVEVCDSLAACSITDIKSVHTQARTDGLLDNILENIENYIDRCEIMALKKVILSTVITYKNLNDTETLSRFTQILVKLLPSTEDICIKNNFEEYNALLYWMLSVGIDVNHLLE